jgi:hypothetical protein
MARGAASTRPWPPGSSTRGSGPWWRAPQAATDAPKPALSRPATRGWPPRHGWPGRRGPAGAGGAPARGRRRRLAPPLGPLPPTLAGRRPGRVAEAQAALPGTLCVVAHQRGRTGAPVRSSAHHGALAWQPRPRPDGPGLAPGDFRRGPAAGLGPRPPRRRVHKPLAPMLLQRSQGVHRMATGIEARGDQAGEHAGEGGARLGARDQRVGALPDAPLPDPCGHMIGARRPWRRAKARQGCPGRSPRANGSAQRAVWLPQMSVSLRVAPTLARGQQRLARPLGGRPARLSAQLLLAPLFVLVHHLPDPLAHSLARLGKPRGAGAARAPARGQPVTADHRRFLGHRLARQRVRQGARFCEARLAFVPPPLEVFPRLAAAGVIQQGGWARPPAPPRPWGASRGAPGGGPSPGPGPPGPGHGFR